MEHHYHYATHTRDPLSMLSNDEYYQVTLDMNTAIQATGQIFISIYLDPSGTILVQDSLGNDINELLIRSTFYTYPFVDSRSGTPTFVDGYMTFTFDNGGSLSNDDLHNSEYWYRVKGVNLPENPPNQFT